MKKMLSIGTFFCISLIMIVIFRAPVAQYVCGTFNKTVRAQDECMKTIAIKLQDPFLCEKIMNNDFYTTGQPRDYCYIWMAKLKKNEHFCEKVGTDKDLYGWNNQNSCYIRAAMAKKDHSICDQISNAQQKEICVDSKFTE